MLHLSGEDLTIEQVVAVARGMQGVGPYGTPIRQAMQRSCEWVQAAVGRDAAPIYGVNTGFGPLARHRVEPAQVRQLSYNLILSSMVGVGPALGQDVVRAMMLIRANTFAKGHSGVRPELGETLLAMLNQGVTPQVPSKGSLGASGDLAPLAHLAAVICAPPSGQPAAGGAAWYQGELLPAEEAMRRAGVPRLELEAKEGLALTNGTTFMLAAAALGVHDAGQLIRTAEVAAALSLEALCGIRSAFDPRLHRANAQPGQAVTAANLLDLVQGSRLMDSMPERVQDAYSLRCTPQVVGPVRDLLGFLRLRVSDALNAASDNPLIFPAEGEGLALTGGNFHGQGPALWLDLLGIAAAQLGTISERRSFRLVTPELSEGLPAMLVPRSGLDSGMMLPQYTAAALVSDNKTLAHPDSVDSIPSSANQEDHVSMGANAARHALEILLNVRHILAIELLTAAQGVELRPEGPQRLGAGTAAAYQTVRQRVKFLEHDRPLAPDIEALADLIATGELLQAVQQAMGREL
jgi:histidine ammonia-lyase